MSALIHKSALAGTAFLSCRCKVQADWVDFHLFEASTGSFGRLTDCATCGGQVAIYGQFLATRVRFVAGQHRYGRWLYARLTKAKTPETSEPIVAFVRPSRFGDKVCLSWIDPLGAIHSHLDDVDLLFRHSGAIARRLLDGGADFGLTKARQRDTFTRLIAEHGTTAKARTK